LQLYAPKPNATQAHMSRTIEVCLTPALLNLYAIEKSIVVVIDILRATSSITYGIENGATAIIPVEHVEDCLPYAESGFLLAAERNGEVVAGYDFGNSPFSYTKEKVNGKTIVLTTTNGTKAMQMAQARAAQVVIGSFLNLTSLCDWLKVQDKDVLLLCAGWKDKFNLEDTLFAGAVVNALRKDFVHFDDSCVAAEDMYLMAKHDLRTYLHKSSHSHRLEQLNIEKDVQFCLKLDVCKAIPVLEGDRLTKLKIEQ
jgi:2-phosphosulfolactate phosphatase